MSNSVPSSLASSALCISFQGHMLVITNLWGVEIPCHYFFDSKTCLPPAKEEKRSQYGIYFQNGSKWKLTLPWNRLRLSCLLKWLYVDTERRCLGKYKWCKRKLFGFVICFSSVNVQFYAKTFNLSLSSSVQPVPGWGTAYKAVTFLLPGICQLSFAFSFL